MTRIVLDLGDKQPVNVVSALRIAARSLLVGDGPAGDDVRWVADQVMEQVEAPRPLIVLDPSKFNIPWVCTVLRGEESDHLRSGSSYVADQIEAQTKPSRIEEPPRGAHVMAQLGAAHKPEKFLRFAVADSNEYHWVSLRTGSVYIWNALTNPSLGWDVES